MSTINLSFLWALSMTPSSRGRKPPVWFLNSSHLISALQPAARTQCESTGGGMPPQTGDREREPWGAATMEVAETNRVYVALHLPLCAHTPHVKPSDACTAALTCQSKLGEGPQVSLTKSNHPLAAHVGEGINKDVKGKKKEEGLDL